MTSVRYQLLLLLIISIFAFSVSAEGLDESVKKPAEGKAWTQRFAEMTGLASGFSKSYALVIGISQFSDYKDLPTDKDPLRVRDFLLASGFDEVHILTEEKVSVARLSELMLDEFPRKVDDNDRFLLYWSGHGVERNNSSGGQTGYLPLANSSKQKFSSMASMDDISRWDDFLKARHALYLIDACFGGLAGVTSKSSQAELVVEQMLKPARFLLTAGSSEEEVIASDTWGGSLFTHALLSGLKGAADTGSNEFPSDGVISLFELINHIKKRVAVERKKSKWPKPLTPQLRDLRGSDGEFFFLTSDFKKSNLPVAVKDTTVITKSGLEDSLSNNGNEDDAAQRSLDETKDEALDSSSNSIWREDIAEFIDNPFDLCGFKGFTASLANSSTTVINIRSTDRSIPDRPFRGFEKLVPIDQLIELFPGCTVRVNSIKTNSTPRIRIRVKEEN